MRPRIASHSWSPVWRMPRKNFSVAVYGDKSVIAAAYAVTNNCLHVRLLESGPAGRVTMSAALLVAPGAARVRRDGCPALWGPVAIGPADFGRAGDIGRAAAWSRDGYHRARGISGRVYGGCFSCHTAPGGEPLAGGRALATPFGTFYSPNLTPDVETGIGGWTDAQFLRALRKGIRPDGSDRFPVFLPLVSHQHNHERRADDQGLPFLAAPGASPQPRA